MATGHAGGMLAAGEPAASAPLLAATKTTAAINLHFIRSPPHHCTHATGANRNRANGTVQRPTAGLITEVAMENCGSNAERNQRWDLANDPNRRCASAKSHNPPPQIVSQPRASASRIFSKRNREVLAIAAASIRRMAMCLRVGRMGRQRPLERRILPKPVRRPARKPVVMDPPRCVVMVLAPPSATI